MVYGITVLVARPNHSQICAEYVEYATIEQCDARWNCTAAPVDYSIVTDSAETPRLPPLQLNVL